MTKELPLSKGKVALVDDEDYERLSQYKWHALEGRSTSYAYHSVYVGGIQKSIKMHREIMSPPDDMLVDHINGNGLDNRKENLRIVTTRQNSQNLHIEKSSQYPGVTWNENHGKWMATIGWGNVRSYLGYFDNELDAARAYRIAENFKKDEREWFVKISFERKKCPYRNVTGVVEWCRNPLRLNEVCCLEGCPYKIEIFPEPTQETIAAAAIAKDRERIREAIIKYDNAGVYSIRTDEILAIIDNGGKE